MFIQYKDKNKDNVCSCAHIKLLYRYMCTYICTYDIILIYIKYILYSSQLKYTLFFSLGQTLSLLGLSITKLVQAENDQQFYFRMCTNVFIHLCY